MEGDYDHIVNRGSLCVKGISMFATHASPNRLKTPPLPSTGQRPLGGHLLGGRDLFHWSLCSKEHVELIPSVFVNYPQIIKKRELLGRAAMLWPGSDISSAIFDPIR